MYCGEETGTDLYDTGVNHESPTRSDKKPADMEM